MCVLLDIFRNIIQKHLELYLDKIDFKHRVKEKQKQLTKIQMRKLHSSGHMNSVL